MGADPELLARLQAGEVLERPVLSGLPELDRDAFGAGTLGLVWDRIALGELHAHLDVDRRHLQPHGLVHGGVWCAVVESMASVGAWLQVAAQGRVAVGVHNSTDFLRSHRTGRVDGVATPIHLGGTQQLWQVVLSRSGDGAVVARGQVRLAVIDPDGRPG